MAGSQHRQAPFAQRLGYGLGRLVKRAGASWALFEHRLVQRAGNRAPVAAAAFLLLKVGLAVAGVIAVLYAALWIAVVIFAVFTLTTLSGRSVRQENSILDDGFNTAWDPWNFWKS